ncbi:c-type cytochrome [Halodurantibacterium flavum]|uniref:C-type cytochrome n=1 Tax=Halodurantibacterium flavum TaxID=1382802 RepID=A0ABW4S7M4_9RHOB
MRRLLTGLVALLLLVGAAILWLTQPDTLPPDRFAGLEGDAARGENVFWAAGCASCHSAEGAEGDDRLVLTGGRRFASEFGTFVAPNISSDPTYGIGNWSLEAFGNAVMRGVSPDGAHYYPAFPYTAYARMEPQDLVDLYAFMGTLPPADRPTEPHELAFPFNVRTAAGLWKTLFFEAEGWAVEGDLTPSETRGRYIAEALAHCGECHTPRNALGALETSRWFAGAPNPAGEGRIPNISPALLHWSREDLVAYFTYGFTPDFDSAGGSMAEVVQNLAQLPEADREALADYLLRVAPVQ